MDSGVVVTPPHVAKPLRLEPFTAMTLSASRVADPASARAFARPYRAVADRLRQWERRGHVTRDRSPALYVHEYTSAGLTVRGVVGAMDLTRLATSVVERAVWPHEGVHPVQAEELASRMLEMAMNPAPVLLVHRGPEDVRRLVAETCARTPWREFTDRAGQRQRIWAIRDQTVCDRLGEALAGTEALLADGHHRYAAYLRIRQQHAGTAWDRGLAMLVDQDDTPLFLGAIHRVLGRVRLDELLDAGRQAGCATERRDRDEAFTVLGPRTLVATDGSSWASVQLPDRAGLPVEHLHRALLPALPRMPRVAHHHTVEAALADTGPRRVAVLMPAPEYDEVQRVLVGGGLLPEKATSFQPKPSLGALMRSIHDG